MNDKEMQDTKGQTGFVYHDDYLLHTMGEWHPEQPKRLTSIVNYLRKNDLWDSLIHIQPYPAEVAWLETVHARPYIQSVEAACQSDQFQFDADTAVNRHSYRVALLAVGGALAAADAIVAGKVKNAFCAIRPPGHHAEKDAAMGFCLFNNVAITARYLQRQYDFKKILIIDWDVHHGNGTQNAFYSDPSVFYFSTHQWPHYPGSGLKTERGEGDGLGYTLNVPMASGQSDAEYVEVFEQILLPAAQRFEPDFILISAGFDAHSLDQLSGMEMTRVGYGKLTEIVMRLADEYCDGRIISLLEGGYNLEMLAQSVARHLEVLQRRRVS
ncbi:MAG: histone deacetylase [Candidatus Zhuqueibacterota bacterium]